MVQGDKMKKWEWCWAKQGEIIKGSRLGSSDVTGTAQTFRNWFGNSPCWRSKGEASTLSELSSVSIVSSGLTSESHSNSHLLSVTRLSPCECWRCITTLQGQASFKSCSSFDFASLQTVLLPWLRVGVDFFCHFRLTTRHSAHVCCLQLVIACCRADLPISEHIGYSRGKHRIPPSLLYLLGLRAILRFLVPNRVTLQ
jgi:hypothetical protein